MTAILEVNNLVKHFNNVKAVRGVSFSIEPGTCFGLLGPNGAGKTTTLEMIEGITEPTSGDIRYKCRPVDKRFKQEAGFLFQSTAIQEFLTVKETLRFFERLYDDTVPLESLIETCSLAGILDRDTRQLSGGQRQRMLLALALINKPEIVFLDEPTTGLDPQSRRNFWDMIREIRKSGKTIVLTTHYMDEAEILCDVIAIMDRGQIVEIASTQAMLKTHFDDIVMELPRIEYDKIESTMNVTAEMPEIVDTVHSEDKVLLYTTNLHETLRFLNDSAIDLSRLQIRSRNLEDLFIKLTGKDLRA